MKAILFITAGGEPTARELGTVLPESEVVDLRGRGRLRAWMMENFHRYDGHVCIMSLGIVYRVISDLIRNKYEDPAVVVVDDARRYAIAALSGHEGGANALCWKTAALLGCEPVVTTASDTNKPLTLGVGCRRGVSASDVREGVLSALDACGRVKTDVRIAGSVDLKRNEEGLVQAFEDMEIALVFLDSGRIREFSGAATESAAARRQLNLPGVSEPCALLLGRRASLILPRTVYGPVTVALADETV